MSSASVAPIRSLRPEKVAYWYFRLNGFLQIENFVIHPQGGGSQRTDADLLAVRFPFRAERLFDDPEGFMADDEKGLALTDGVIDVVIAEVKTNQPCTLNGPWTKPERKNVHRVLAAVGCLPREEISAAAKDIYRTGLHRRDTLRVRLVAVGRARDERLAAQFPDVTQLCWIEMLPFIWERFHRYARHKRQVDQWDDEGRVIKELADRSHVPADFVRDALERMGIRDA